VGSVFTVLGSYLSSCVYLGWVSLGPRTKPKEGGGDKAYLMYNRMGGGGGWRGLERFRDPYRVQ
jgi:hypothetical protein